MRVLVESLISHSFQLRRRAVRRTRFVMRRLGWLVPRARVQLAEVNGPRQEVYKRCQVELRTDAAAPVVITSLARDWRSALDNALSRAARTVLWLWRRQRKTAMLQGRPLEDHRLSEHAVAKAHAMEAEQASASRHERTKSATTASEQVKHQTCLLATL